MSPCSLRLGRSLLVLSLAGAVPAFGTTDLSTVPLPTYSSGSTTDIKPNLMFVLDDSGSMDWDYMPDWANDVPANYYSLPIYLTRNNAFNGVAYNPAVTYLAPYKFNSDGTRDTATYPSMTGTTAATGANTGSTTPNWKAVKNDGYGVQSTGTTDLTGNAYYYTVIPGEYCNSPNLTTCTTTSSATGLYQYPANLRWCNSTDLTTCRGTQNSTYSYPRIPAPPVSTITFANSTTASVTGITVNGQQIMSGASTASDTSSTVASRVATLINNCTGGITGNCTVSGYYAHRQTNGTTVSIFAPSANTFTPVLSKTGTVTVTGPTAFARTGSPSGTYLSGTASTSAVPGQNILTAITSTVDSYPYPGTAAKASTRTDCAGTTCTYVEEMTNYANWWAYYRTRMQMMKTSTSLAFSSLDSATDLAAGTSRFRVGFMTLNNNTGSDFVNITDFATAQKVTWYSKLFAANPNNSTPLRQALAQAGQLYGGKYNGTTFRGSTVVDPLQYSCQKNFTILSTDGYWNGNGGTKLDQSTSVGQQDGTLPRPYNDGATVTIEQRTSQLQQRITVRTAQKGTLQSQTSQLQRRTAPLQERNNAVQMRTSTLQARTHKVQVRWNTETRTSSDGGNNWSAWSYWTDTNSACDPDTNGQSRRQCQNLANLPSVWQDVSSCRDRGAWMDCQYVDEGLNNATGACTVGAPTSPTLTPYASQCTYTGWSGYVDAGGSCTWASQNNTNLTARQCQYAGLTSFADTASTCTVQSTQGTATTNGTTWLTVRACQYGTFSAYANAGSCTAAQSTSSPYTVTTAVQCQTVVTSAFADAGSCTVTAANGSGVSTQCQYRFDAAEARDSCTPAYVANNFTNAQVWANCTDTVGSWTNVVSPATCVVAAFGAEATGERRECQYGAWTGWSNVASCTAAAQSTSSPYSVNIARECNTTSSGGVSNTLADVAAYYYNTDLRSSTATGTDATGTNTTDKGCTGPIIAPSTVANNLCTDNVPTSGRDTNTKQHMVTHTLGLGMEGRMIFSNYQNDSAGSRSYVPDYWNHQSGDFYDVMNGTVATGSTICSWQSSGACNWPAPSADSQANIDDLWHAAVNGRGTYFTARDPQTLADSLRSVLSEIIRTPRPGTAAAAATSNPNITSTDNYVFSSSYLSLDWYGELIMQRVNTNGTLGNQQWSAMRLLDCRTSPWRMTKNYVVGDVYNNGGNCYYVHTDYTSGSAFGGTDTANTTQFTGDTSSRVVYTASSGSRIPFTYSDLSTAQKAYFGETYVTYVSASQGLSQFCSTGGSCLSTAAKTAAAGQALVDFLRGDRTNEGTYYRSRKKVLGDIVSSEARYVKAPLQSYTDANYSTFKSDKATRDGMVYVGANDGMLHAFNADTGVERWAFVPPAILPTMYKLADTNYTTKHQFFVDGSPEVGDICPNAPSTTCSATQWKTILVGGLNLGGKAYYALDVTDPANPIFLWEFTNTNLGYSFSNPRITKLKDGTWVVIVASGYQTADGHGRLFVLNANTGALIREIDTGAGDTTSEAGLARISARAPINNVVEAVYGGDLLGNLWRFDVNGDVGASGYDAHLLVNLKDGSGVSQPITVRPTVTSINSSPVLIVTTGRYLGINDLSTTQTQTVYAVKDKLDTATLINPRTTGSNFVQQTIAETTCPDGTAVTICSPGQSVRTTTTSPVDWGVRNGWYVDLPTTGERGVTDSTLALGTLAFTTLVPQTSSGGTISCTADSSPSARGYLYYMDYLTGGSVAGANGVIGEYIGDGVPTRVSVFRNLDGTIRGITRMSGVASGSSSTEDGTGLPGSDLASSREDNLPGGGASGTTPSRRAWRILNTD